MSSCAPELRDRVRGHDADARHVVLLAAQHRPKGRIEDLKGDRARLLQDPLAVLRIGVVAEVGALVEEPPALTIDDDAQRIALAGKPIGELAVGLVVGCEGIPLDAVRGRPVASFGGADRAAPRRSSRRCCTACRAPSRCASRDRGVPHASRDWTRSHPTRGPRSRREAHLRPESSSTSTPTTRPSSTTSPVARVP